jgi:hypothetical protein
MPGIEQTKDVVKFVVALGVGAAKSYEDKKLSFMDLANFLGAVTAFPAAISGISEVPAELADMDATERQELVDYIKEEFDIPQDALEARVEEALGICSSIYDFVMHIIDDAKKSS